VILAVRLTLGEQQFFSWGWRIPFILSLALVVIGVVLRWKLRETPLFMRLKETGRASRAPLRESLLSTRNWRLILIALFGAVAGQAVVWYTGQFVALYYLQNIFKVDLVTANLAVGIGLALATPFFVFFGWLSDRVGRKKIMMLGNIIAAVTYYPLYMTLGSFAASGNLLGMIAIVFIMGLYVTMVYGPIAAFLVEYFPARIRYTSLSVPYHLGNGEFGGWTLTIIPAVNYFFASQYAGLLWPISVAIATFIIGMIFLPETHKRSIWEEVEGSQQQTSSKRD
jgi:MFS family permease